LFLNYLAGTHHCFLISVMTNNHSPRRDDETKNQIKR
jgi:hypothetical protein